MSEEKQQTKTKPESDSTTNEGLNLLSKAAETIAGDNKLLGNILKFVLSPLGLIALLCGLGYLIWKNKSHKDKIVALEKELLDANYEIKDLKKEVAVLEKRRKPKLIEEYEHESEETEEISYVPKSLAHQRDNLPIRNKNIHLD